MTAISIIQKNFNIFFKKDLLEIYLYKAFIIKTFRQGLHNQSIRFKLVKLNDLVK